MSLCLSKSGSKKVHYKLRPPWLKTTSTGALVAGIAKTHSHKMNFTCLFQKSRQFAATSREEVSSLGLYSSCSSPTKDVEFLQVVQLSVMVDKVWKSSTKVMISQKIITLYTLYAVTISLKKQGNVISWLLRDRAAGSHHFSPCFLNFHKLIQLSPFSCWKAEEFISLVYSWHHTLPQMLPLIYR